MDCLQMLIETYRTEMIKLADEYGRTSPQTLECSQQLDTLVNLWLYHEQHKHMPNSDLQS